MISTICLVVGGLFALFILVTWWIYHDVVSFIMRKPRKKLAAAIKPFSEGEKKTHNCYKTGEYYLEFPISQCECGFSWAEGFGKDGIFHSITLTPEKKEAKHDHIPLLRPKTTQGIGSGD